MGSTGIPLERLVNLDQLDVNFEKITTYFGIYQANNILKLILLFLKTLLSKSYFSGIMC